MTLLDVHSCVEALRSSEAVLVATDTVCGIAALPGSDGYARIFELKERPAEQTLPWLVVGSEALDAFAENVPGYAKALASMFWPGALTLVVNASRAAKETGCVAQDGTVALRMPHSAPLLAVLRELGEPLACTSANVHGDAAPMSPEDVDERFLELSCLDGFDKASPSGCASTIVDCTGEYPRILREGAISSPVILHAACMDATLAPKSNR